MLTQQHGAAFLRRLAPTFALLFCLTAPVSAERLPLRVYSSADGLATSVIHHAMRDSQGFLWFSGRGGLSRFDGYEFVSYRLADQSTPLVHCMLETRDGKY